MNTNATFVHRPTLVQILTAPDEPQGLDQDTSRPPSPASLDGELVDWCRLPRDVQVATREARRFERRLQAEARQRNKDGWPPQDLEAFVKHHRERFARRSRQGQSPTSPCKHWRAKCGESDLMPLMDTIWGASLPEWAREYPYLASPSAPCECETCDPGLAKMRKSERDGRHEFGPMEYPL